MYRLCIVVSLVVAAATNAIGQESARPQTETLSGKVIDAAGKPVEKAVVVICDDATGIPLTEEARVPFTDAVDSFLDDLSYRSTEPDGSFRFEKLPKGKYKLVAQSWPESNKGVSDLMRVHGGSIELRGIVTGIEVPVDDAKDVIITPLGTATVDVITDPISPNDDVYLIVSTGKTIADPILLFWSWGANVPLKAIGASAMPGGKLRVAGLPDGEIQIVAFANDNVPGFGAVTIAAKPGETVSVTLPIVAGWSDGHHEAPDRLKALVEEFASEKLTEADLNAIFKDVPKDPPPRHFGDLMNALGGPQALVRLPDGREIAVGDLLAASSYAQIQELRKTAVPDAVK